jgi:AcrR family transcriptional regulator
LINAARREFVRHGIQRARIEDITAACGLSKGAFYLHFDSKEHLFEELVTRVQQQLDAMLDDRQRDYAALLKRGLTEGQRTTLEALDRRHDRASLEIIWEHRDVIDVLLRGCQGTHFEGVLWSFVDREVQRVADTCDQLKKLGLCRQELPSEVVGSMVVGTWVLLARRMASLEKKPDVDFWVDALKRLLNEGTVPPVARSAKPPKLAARRVTAARERRAVRSHS